MPSFEIPGSSRVASTRPALLLVWLSAGSVGRIRGAGGLWSRYPQSVPLRCERHRRIGWPLPTIAALFGHSQPQTMTQYDHLSADPIRTASEGIGSRIAGALRGVSKSDGGNLI
jgi:hypothetical protein